MHSDIAILMRLHFRAVDSVCERLVCTLNHNESILKQRCDDTHLALLPFLLRDVAQRIVALPHLVLRQPRLEFLMMFTQGQSEQLITCDEQRQRRFADLVVKDFSPLVVSKSRELIVERPGELVQFGLPFGARLEASGGVIVVYIPNHSKRSVGC